jgi:hypothetical protein
MQQEPLSESLMPVWQCALMALGCHLDVGSHVVPLELRPVENRILCTPPVSGAMLPFDLPVQVGQTVTITWDSVLSRYLVEVAA